MLSLRGGTPHLRRWTPPLCDDASVRPPTPEDLAVLLEDDLVVADIGARWGAADRWRPFGPGVQVVGFDPDEEECRRLEAAEPDVRYVPVALGAEAGPATLHTTAEPACASLYPPTSGIVERFPALHGMASTGRVEIEVTTLDDWLAGSDLDALHILKLDTQGSELDILTGATDALRDVRFLEVEVELNPLYSGQPLFGDVDRFLRDRGFVLWRLGHLVHYGLAGTSAEETFVGDSQHFDTRTVPFTAGGGQAYWAHAYFVAADALEPTADRVTGVRDAVAATAFGFPDLALHRLRAAGIDGY